MDDSTYARVVEEFKNSKAHRGLDATAQTLYSITATLCMMVIDTIVWRAQQQNSVERSSALYARVKTLTVWQYTEALASVTHTLATFR